MSIGSEHAVRTGPISDKWLTGLKIQERRFRKSGPGRQPLAPTVRNREDSSDLLNRLDRSSAFECVYYVSMTAMILGGRKMKFASRKRLHQQKKTEKQCDPAKLIHLSKKADGRGEARGEERSQ